MEVNWYAKQAMSTAINIHCRYHFLRRRYLFAIAALLANLEFVSSRIPGLQILRKQWLKIVPNQL